MAKITTIKELDSIKQKLINEIEQLDNQWITDAYYKGFDKFIQCCNNLENKPLPDMTIKEIKFINFINSINIYDLEFIFKEL